ncbi:MAG: pilus assembly protein PilP [Smithellaceae bacterium]|nr:pilus assembly protein PilP [Smithellaceae bacterium]
MKKNKTIILCNLLILFTTVVYAFCAETNKPFLQTQTPSLLQVLQTRDNAYSYNPLGKPDPFKPFVDGQITAVKKGKDGKAESIFPLQREEVESFKLVGIMGDQIRRVAVIEDSAKKFYPLFIGTRIGLHNGKVTDILADRVMVDELDGKKVKRIILQLHKNLQ